jgi:methyl-accepting chemotaxis protein
MNKLSLTQKFMLLLVPLAIVGGIVSVVTWKALSRGVSDLEQASKLDDDARDSKLNVVEMGDAMKGFILDPSNKSELDRKKKADEFNAKSLEEMKTLTHDPQTMKLIQELADFDGSKLDPAEQEVMKLVAAGQVTEAQAHYVKNYLPLRSLYMELHTAMSDRVHAEVESATHAVDQDMRRSAILIICSLMGGLFAVGALIVWSVSRLSRNITSLVEKLFDGSNVVAGASSQVSETGQDLAQSSTQQAAALQQTVASIEQVSAMVGKNAENAKRSEGVSESSHQAATRGKNVVQEMIGSIHAISQSNDEIFQQIEQSNREISEIVQVISEIGNKTKVINDIVFQTKLLSFNASVEAARAGEHGKGFAVVAEEVGNLAAMSGRASKDISDMLAESISKVEGIVNNTSSKVQGLIQAGKSKVDAGTQVAEKCGQVLDEIVGNVSDLKRMVQEISTASNEQAQGVQEITKAMSQLDQVTHRNSSASQKSSEAASQLSGQAVELKALVAALTLQVRGSAEGDGSQRAA